MELFPDKLITSISFSQDEILRDIIRLYLPGGIECDCTYSKGNFYKSIPKPKLKFDIKPVRKDVVKACSTKLPLDQESIKSLMFDPPFVASHNIESQDYLMTERFTNIQGMSLLQEMYSKSITEFYRVLKKRGVLIVKCQDTVYGRKNIFNHVYIYNEAVKHGFKGYDLFILLAKSRFVSSDKQCHARKFHSYFWVFKK